MSRQFVQISSFIIIVLVQLNSVAQDQEQQKYTIKSIYFGGGSYFIDEEQRQAVQEFVNSIPNKEHYSVTVHSHTDNIGGAVYNEWLSQMRSDQAVFLLEATGIDPAMVEIKDFGQFNPVYDNSTWEGRVKNRRVDIIFWPVAL